MTTEEAIEEVQAEILQLKEQIAASEAEAEALRAALPLAVAERDAAKRLADRAEAHRALMEQALLSPTGEA